MEKYNEKLLDATRKLSQTTLQRSNRAVYKLTHPSSKVSKIGSTIGTVVGVGFVGVGASVTASGRYWGVAMCFAGILTIVSNVVKVKMK